MPCILCISNVHYVIITPRLRLILAAIFIVAHSYLYRYKHTETYIQAIDKLCALERMHAENMHEDRHAHRHIDSCIDGPLDNIYLQTTSYVIYPHTMASTAYTCCVWVLVMAWIYVLTFVVV